jgi:hypothetical protein
MKQERRQVQRITLEAPIEGSLNKQAVSIIDLSTTGARVEHPTPISGRKTIDLRLDVGGNALVVPCELTRSRLQRSARDRSSVVYCSGLRFAECPEDVVDAIRGLVASLVRDRFIEPALPQTALSVAV